MKITEKTIRKAIGFKEDLEYMIDRIKTEGLDYINIEDLEKVKEKVTNDIAEFQKEQKTNCPALKPGAIIRVNTGDGISYSQRNYYKISKITDTFIYFDLITVGRGDYGNEFIVDRISKERKEEWIKRYNKNYHKDDVPEDEWNELMRYSEQIPWPKENVQ